MKISKDIFGKPIKYKCMLIISNPSKQNYKKYKQKNHKFNKMTLNVIANFHKAI